MSLLSSRVGLTHLVTIERNSGAAAGDGWEGSPAWQPHLVDQPCRAWTTTGRELVDATNVVVIESLRILVPDGTDVTERDRIASLTYRGVAIVDGPVDIRTVLRRQGNLHAHLELVVMKVG